MNAFSHSAEYAIRALTHLAQQRGDGFSLVRDMSERLGIPAAFLVKVLRPLVGRGLIESRRGRGGGYRLLRPPGQVRLYDIVDAYDRLAAEPSCALGQAVCTNARACPMHGYWKDAFAAFQTYVAETTLDDMVQFCRQQTDCAYPALGSAAPSA